MKASQIVFQAKEKVVCEPCETEPLGDSGVLVRTHCGVISPGTELAFLCQLPNTISKYPFFPGYSSAGEVLEVGKQVRDFKAGDHVALQMSHVSMAVVSPAQCWRIPQGLDLRTAAGFRLVSIPLQGVRKAQIQLGESVLVFGLGIIGNLAGQLARAAGSTCVIGVDPVAWRREVGARCGFDHVLAPDQLEKIPAITGGTGPQVVIEATGVPEPINTAFQHAGRRARVLLLGSTRGLTKEVNFYRDVHKKGLTIIGAHESVRAVEEDVGAFFTHRSDGRTALLLLASQRVQWEPLPARIFPVAQAAQAYQALMQPSEKLMYAVLDWNA